MEATKSANGKPEEAIPGTPEWMAPLSRELESVIAQRNLLTQRTRKKVLEDLNQAASTAEDLEMEKLRIKAVEEVISSEKTYLNHLETVSEFFMKPVRERGLLPTQILQRSLATFPASSKSTKSCCKPWSLPMTASAKSSLNWHPI